MSDMEGMQLGHTALVDMSREGCIPAVVLLSLSPLQVTGGKTRQKPAFYQHQRAVLSSLHPCSGPPLFFHFRGSGCIQTPPILPQDKSQKAFAWKSTLMIQIRDILGLPLWRANRRALGQRGFTWGLSQQQGCGPQLGVAQRSPKTRRNKGPESLYGKVASSLPTLLHKMLQWEPDLCKLQWLSPPIVYPLGSHG